LLNVMVSQPKRAMGTDRKKLNADEKKKNSNSSSMGCTECGEEICDVCWERGTISISNCKAVTVVIHEVYYVLTKR
jgi:hypothetical protein